MSEKLYNFYGMSTPVLLLAPIEVLQEMMDKLTNSFSSHMLNSLCLEAKLLKYSLYGSGQFRFILDEGSKRVQDIIKFSDFSLVYRRYLGDIRNGDNSIGAESEIVDLEDLGGISGAPVDADIPDLGALPEMEELDTDITDLFGDEQAGSAGLDGLERIMGLNSENAAGISDVGIEGLGDLGGSDNSDPPGDLSSPSKSGVPMDLDTAEKQSADALLQAGIHESSGKLDDVEDISSLIDVGNTNAQLLARLAYDTAFFDVFESGDFDAVLTYIEEWTLQEIMSLKDLRQLINSAKKFESQNKTELEEELASLDARYTELTELLQKDPADSELTMKRLKRNTDQRDAVAKALEDIHVFSELFSKDFAERVEALLDTCDKILSKECLLNGQNVTMTKLEFALVSALHRLCSSACGNRTRIDTMIDLLTSTRDRNTVNTKKFLNTEFNVLVAKSSPSRLLTFNKRFSDHLKLYGDITSQVYVKSVEDCVTLLTSKEEVSMLVRPYIIQERPPTSMGGQKEIVPVGMASVPGQAHKLISDGFSKRFGFQQLAAREDYLVSFLQMVIAHGCAVELANSDDSVYALYKVWHLINEYTLVGLAEYAGMIDFVEDEIGEGKMGISAEWCKNFFLKFKIPGIYCDPVGKFIRCLRNGVVLTDRTTTAIDKRTKADLYHNIEVIRRYLESKIISLNNQFPVIEFWR